MTFGNGSAPVLHRIADDLGESGEAWLQMTVDDCIAEAERRLQAEARMDAIDAEQGR